jgi:hypothetical protein
MSRFSEKISGYISFYMFMVCNLISAGLYAQLSLPGTPLPLNYKGISELKRYEIMIPQHLQKNIEDQRMHSLLKPAGQGTLIEVLCSTENAGTWDTLTDGSAIWRASFRVPGASSVNLVFSPYQVNRGVRTYVYDKLQKTVLGAFSDANNKVFSKLATANIPGDEIVVEIQVPPYLKSAGAIGIRSIGCDLASDPHPESIYDEWFGKSGSCNIDVNCNTDSMVQRVKNAVVRIVFNGSERCTGTLVNNTREDGTNYVLTAEHCINREDIANEAVFYFDYESPYCNGPDGSVQKSLSGATIKATGGKLDFTLLELLEPIPFTYKPYYAGWDYTGRKPESGYTIHHPMGDVKKISQEEHPLTVDDFMNDYNPASHWLVGHWESGTTEKGSSGSPLFDSRGHVVGTLSGGLADCENPEKDYFQMFSHCWDDYHDPYHQLACWLDPQYQDVGLLGGYDPYEDLWITGDTLSNIGQTERLVVVHNGLAWGSYSGHNSGYITRFAEKFSVSGMKKMPGLMLHVARNYWESSSSEIVIKIWNGADVPGQEVYEKKIFTSNLTWQMPNFVQFDSIITLNGVFFAGYELEYNLPRDTFATYMAANRTSSMNNTAYVFDASGWKSLSDYTGGSVNSSFAVMPVLFDSLPPVSNDQRFNHPVIAYPVPAESHLWIEFEEIPTLPVNVMVFNLQGQLVLEKEVKAYQRKILLQLEGFSGGFYMVRLNSGTAIHTLRVPVIK